MNEEVNHFSVTCQVLAEPFEFMNKKRKWVKELVFIECIWRALRIRFSVVFLAPVKVKMRIKWGY